MNEIVTKFLLAGDTFMPEMHSKQPGFIYSACVSFTKNKERVDKFMQIGNTDFIYRNVVNKASSQHDMVCGKSKKIRKKNSIRQSFMSFKSFKRFQKAGVGGFRRWHC